MLSHAGRRAKGAAWEREVAIILREVYPTARRGIQPQGARIAGIPDVDGTPWWVECVCGDSQSIKAKWDQAHRDADGSRRPVVVIAKRDRQTPIAVFDLGEVSSHSKSVGRIPAQVDLSAFVQLCRAWHVGPVAVPLREGARVASPSGLTGTVRHDRSAIGEQVLVQWDDGTEGIPQAGDLTLTSPGTGRRVDRQHRRSGSTEPQDASGRPGATPAAPQVKRGSGTV